MASPQAAQALSAFFPGEPLPYPAHPPADAAQNERINLLLKHCVSNGPAFLQTVKERQASDPNFAFLFPHSPEHAYWRWALYCALMGAPPTPPAPAAAALPMPAQPGAGPPVPPIMPQPMPPAQPVAAPAPAPPPPVTSMQLSPEMEAGFAQVLEGLSGSKDSVKAAQQWFMACGPPYAAGLARMMAIRCVNGVQEFERKLHIIYLANDILFKGLSSRTPGQPASSDAIAQAFQPMLGPMLAAVYQKAGRTEEVLTRLNKILSFWAERGVFDAPVVDGMRTAMATISEPAIALAQTLAQVAAAAAAAKAQAAAAAAAAAAAPPPPAPAPASSLPPATSLGPPTPAASIAPWGMMPQPPPGVAPPPPPASSGAPAPPLMWPPPQGAPVASGPWGTPAQPLQPPMGHPYMPPPPHMAIPGQPPNPWYPPPGHPYAPMPPHPMYPPPHPGMVHPALAPPPGFPPAAQPPPPDIADRQRSESPPPAPPSRPRLSKFHSEPTPPPHVQQASAAAAAAYQAQIQQREAEKKQAQPVDSCSFPPGMLPALCRRKRETGGAPYEPLSAADLESMGLPPPPEKDDYLASRCERFFAEMRDYRPGLTRADVEDPGHSWHRMRLKKEYEEDPEGLKQRWWRGGGKRVITGRQEPGRLHADGSFSGRFAEHAGLGAHVASAKARETHPEERSAAAAAEGKSSIDDMYNQYRNLRSGSYHQMIMTNSAKSKMFLAKP